MSGVSSFGDNMSIIKNNNGDDVSLTIRNSAVAGSTDETVSLKFGHITAGGGGKIVSGREGTYTVGAASDSNLQIYTTLNGSDTEKMRIDSDGNVGIGTTSPTKTLEVAGDISASGDIYLEAMQGISFSNTKLSFISSSDAPNGVDLTLRADDDIKLDADDNIQFFTNGSERLRISASGNVGIGTPTPT